MLNRAPIRLLGLAVLAGFAGFSGNAEAGRLGAGIHDATALSPAYSFAERCVVAGALARSDLVQFQARLLDALEEKYSLEVEERQVLQDYLLGAAGFRQPAAGDQIVPAGGRRMSCDTATEISR